MEGHLEFGDTTPNNVGPSLLLRFPIMCFEVCRIQDLGNDLRSPIMSFDFGGLKIIGRILNNPL